MNRLTRRRKMVIAGCVFAAVAVGFVCCGQANAAAMSVAIMGECDQVMMADSTWSWAASSGDLNGIPLLAPGQEVLTGTYRGSLLSTGPGTYRGSRSLDCADIVTFSTGSQVNTEGASLYHDNLLLFSAGSGASGATCGLPALEADAANYTAVPYCESARAGTAYTVQGLDYRSQGTISQADTEQPDSLDFAFASTGDGSGRFAAGSGSMAGIGPAGELGYRDGMRESVGMNGVFNLTGEVHWSSFSGAFGGE